MPSASRVPRVVCAVLPVGLAKVLFIPIRFLARPVGPGNSRVVHGHATMRTDQQASQGVLTSLASPPLGPLAKPLLYIGEQLRINNPVERPRDQDGLFRRLLPPVAVRFFNLPAAQGEILAPTASPPSARADVDRVGKDLPQGISAPPVSTRGREALRVHLSCQGAKPNVCRSEPLEGIPHRRKLRLILGRKQTEKVFLGPLLARFQPSNQLAVWRELTLVEPERNKPAAAVTPGLR